MSSFENNEVFVQHTESYNYDDIARMLDKIIWDKNRKFNRVVIKPNLCFSERIPGATTCPDMATYVTRYFVKKSKEVLVVESDALLNTADVAFDNLGIREAVEKEGGKVINLSKYFPDKYKEMIFPHDLFVNLPVLKTHEFALLTGAVKNMFGMVPEKNRIKYHPILKETLVDMCNTYNEHLVLMDGIVGMEGHGPTRGRSVRMNVLIGGTNPAAVDTLASRIVQIPLEELPHIQYAREQLGIDEIKVYFDGTDMEKLSRRFKRPKLDPITATKMWIWRHKFINDFLFASRFYKVTRFVGLRIRKITRQILGMEKID